jgi:cytochrome c biogenesis protein CcmG/thiol:disulfide interchange protein DsbE
MAGQRNNRINQRKRNTVGALIFGAGLLLVGVAAVIALPKTAAGQAATEEPDTASVVPMAVEYPAPELTLTDLEGKTVSLADYRGQVVLINLWATWCPPCKYEMPTLQAYFEDHGAEGFTLIAINDGDPAEDVVAFAKDYGLTFPVWIDPTYIASEQAFKTNALPSSFVIDREGVVRFAWTGAISLSMLEKYVTPMLGN